MKGHARSYYPKPEGLFIGAVWTSIVLADTIVELDTRRSLGTLPLVCSVASIRQERVSMIFQLKLGIVPASRHYSHHTVATPLDSRLFVRQRTCPVKADCRRSYHSRCPRYPRRPGCPRFARHPRCPPYRHTPSIHCPNPSYHTQP